MNMICITENLHRVAYDGVDDCNAVNDEFKV